MKTMRIGRFVLQIKALVAFFATAALCSVLVVVTITNRTHVERLNMEQIAVEKSIRINDVISRLLYKTQTMSAFVAHWNYSTSDFDTVAKALVDDPAILNVLVAPGGVVSDVYPLAGNEGVLGLNMLDASLPGNKEAILAVEQRTLVFGGPFELIQGGQALVGRLPVFLENENGEEDLWGLVSVTLRYPEVLEGTGLDTLAYQGFNYEIWRISVDTEDKQIIAASNENKSSNLRYIEKHIPILNADWYVRISPVYQWYQFTETWLLIVISLCVSFFVAYIIQSNAQLRNIKNHLEDLVQTDSLTGILNRNGLLHEMERLLRLQKPFLLFYMDIDRFKSINDTYGHNVGDIALKAFAQRIDDLTDGSHIFARISGDEFALVHVDSKLSPEAMEPFWIKLDHALETPVYENNDDQICLCYSRGMSCYPRDGTTIDSLIAKADKAMYKNKKNAHSVSSGYKPP